MITLKELIQRENLNIELPQKLSNFQLYIDTETYKYEKEIQDGNIIHIFDGNIEKMNDEYVAWKNAPKVNYELPEGAYYSITGYYGD